MSYAYAAVSDLRVAIADAAVLTDAQLLSLLEDASRQVDAYTRRTFRVYQATKYFSPPDRPVDPVWSEGSAELWTGDLLAVTSLATDGGDRTYSTAWSAGDYDLVPYNAPAEERPYEGLRRPWNGAQAWPTARRGIKVVGKWGWFERLTDAGTTLGAAITSTTATSIMVASGVALSPGLTLLIDSEQFYVKSVSGVTVGVDRGVNGTTAATHSNGAAIQRYVYPSSVVQATLALAGYGLTPMALTGVQRKRSQDLEMVYSQNTPVVALSRLDAFRRKLVFA